MLVITINSCRGKQAEAAFLVPNRFGVSVTHFAPASMSNESCDLTQFLAEAAASSLP
jgi:hypothetical protein